MGRQVITFTTFAQWQRPHNGPAGEGNGVTVDIPVPASVPVAVTAPAEDPSDSC